MGIVAKRENVREIKHREEFLENKSLEGGLAKKSDIKWNLMGKNTEK